ncbi:MAG: acetylornithine transaminase [Candidatus Nanopelagicales bacterium]|nr:acetylornithine transaminase [Candidatus Nanopelagicales bacterium]MDZ4249648.1 acetylornithine transaminase [Candidatus Nanopelagicales bacterium]
MNTKQTTDALAATAALAKRWQAVMMGNYGTPPLALTHGQGCRVWDVDGNEYSDLIAGIAVSTLGHNHPAIVEAVTRQVSRIAHTSNLAMHEPGVLLAERLTGLLGQDARVFFCQDGATANEAAFKIARRHGWEKDPSGGSLEIIAAEGSFHGRTMGALAITGGAPKRAPFEPLPGPVKFVPYGDADALADAVSERTAAVFLEPTLGEGGIVVPPAGYMAEARRVCDTAGALLIVDEVQSGMGRTGDWFAISAQGVVPDVITLAKGLAGGLPLGACVAVGDCGGLLRPGDHGSTFGGNPVSCAAALAVIDTIDSQDLLASVRRVGDRMAREFDGIDDPWLLGHRGVGLWRGLRLSGPNAAAVEKAARDKGFLVNAVRPDVVRVAPPLILSEQEADEFTAALPSIFRSARADQGDRP